MIKARHLINPSHACHSSDVLTPTERAADSMINRQSKVASVKFSEVTELKDSLMSAVNHGISMSDCPEAIDGLTSIEREILDIVPSSDAWRREDILRDSCVRNKTVRDMPTIQRCLDSLLKQRLIVEVTRGKYRKARSAASYLTSQIIQSKPTNQIANVSSESASASRDQRELLMSYVERMRQLSNNLSVIANGIENIFEEISVERESIGKLNELRSLLKQFVE